MNTRHLSLLSAIVLFGGMVGTVSADEGIPAWVKQVAEFWIAGDIDDAGFVQVIEYLVQEDVIAVPNAEAPESPESPEIPNWIKSSSDLWAKGDITDAEYATSIEWLINNGVIRVSMEGTGHGSELVGEVPLGFLFPLTGDLATHGLENKEGSVFGVEEFNMHLEEIGAPWQFRIFSEDSATSPVVALEKLTALKAKGIDIVIGPETSSNIRNVLGYANSNNMLLVSCCSSAPSLAIPGDSVFRLVPDDSNQGVALAKLMRHEGIEVMVPVWRADTWGDGLSNAASTSFTERGGIVAEGIRYNPESPEFSTSASLLASAVQEYVDEHGADKVAVMFLGFAETLQFIQSSHDHEVLNQVRWFGPGAITKEHKRICLDF